MGKAANPHIAKSQGNGVQKKTKKVLSTKAMKRKVKAIEKACAFDDKLDKRKDVILDKKTKLQARKSVWD
ncbi:hypothetical protein H4R33_003152 [Dimargaris cristalligena]|nr:hypothetical protein H4R33_003152 [Dimargaris cristalligena]